AANLYHAQSNRLAAATSRTAQCLSVSPLQIGKPCHSVHSYRTRQTRLHLFYTRDEEGDTDLESVGPQKMIQGNDWQHQLLGRRPGPKQHAAVLFRAGVEIQAGVLRTDIDVPERALQCARRVHCMRTGTAEEPCHGAAAQLGGV